MGKNQFFLICMQQVPEVLNLAKLLVNQDSGTNDLEGLKKKAILITDLFKQEGAGVEWLPSAPPREGKWNLAVRFHGTGKAKILILTHYDTVFPAGEAARRPFFCDGKNAYGPGVADMQTSIAMVLTGLHLLHRNGWRDYDTLTVFCNSDEESGSWGSRDQITELAREHDIALNMELSGADGNLITVSARGMATGTLRVKGKAAHSAAEPPAGINAGLELAHQLLQLSHLSKPKIRLAVNATLGSFGTSTNVIPEDATATLNIRVAEARDFEKVEEEIRSIIKNKLFPECKVDFDMRLDVMPYGNNATTLELAEKIRVIARKELGMELGYRHAIGSNDTCFSAQVCPSLDGFGPGCVAMHSEKEHLPIATVGPKLYLLVRMIQEVCLGNILPLNRAEGQKEGV